jgi:hypothetical protein
LSRHREVGDDVDAAFLEGSPLVEAARGLLADELREDVLHLDREALARVLAVVVHVRPRQLELGDAGLVAGQLLAQDRRALQLPRVRAAPLGGRRARAGCGRVRAGLGPGAQVLAQVRLGLGDLLDVGRAAAQLEHAIAAPVDLEPLELGFAARQDDLALALELVVVVVAEHAERAVVLAARRERAGAGEEHHAALRLVVLDGGDARRLVVLVLAVVLVVVLLLVGGESSHQQELVGGPELGQVRAADERRWWRVIGSRGTVRRCRRVHSRVPKPSATMWTFKTGKRRMCWPRLRLLNPTRQV